MELYVFLLLAVLGTDSKAIDGSWTEFCPVNCTCDYLYKEVACSGRYNIPNIFPTGVRSLQMTRGQLLLLEQDSFNHKDLGQLEKLKLKKNAITKIDKKAFVTLKNLTTIDLSNNNLTYVHPETFQYNTKLAILKLSLNPLSLDGHSKFLVSPSIKYLDLQGCNVDSVSTEAVSGLPRLSFLDLSNNPLASCNEEELKSLGITVRFDDHLCEVTSDAEYLSTTCSTELVDELDVIIPENRLLDQDSDADYGRDAEQEFSSTEDYVGDDNSSLNDTAAKPISVDCGLSKTYDVSSATMIAIYVIVLIIALALGFFIGLFIQRGGRGDRYLSFGDTNTDMQKDDVPVSEPAESSTPTATQTPVQSPLPIPASRHSVVPEQSPVPVASPVQTFEEVPAPETSPQPVDQLGSPVKGPSSVQAPATASYQEKDKIEI